MEPIKRGSNNRKRGFARAASLRVSFYKKESLIRWIRLLIVIFKEDNFPKEEKKKTVKQRPLTLSYLRKSFHHRWKSRGKVGLVFLRFQLKLMDLIPRKWALNFLTDSLPLYKLFSSSLYLSYLPAEFPISFRLTGNRAQKKKKSTRTWNHLNDEVVMKS